MRGEEEEEEEWGRPLAGHPLLLSPREPGHISYGLGRQRPNQSWGNTSCAGSAGRHRVLFPERTLAPGETLLSSGLTSPCRTDALGMRFYLQQCSLDGSGPSGLSGWLGAPTAFARDWKWCCMSGAGILFSGKESSLTTRSRQPSQDAVCTPPLCAWVVGVSHSQHTQTKEFHSSPASK